MRPSVAEKPSVSYEDMVVVDMLEAMDLMAYRGNMPGDSRSLFEEWRAGGITAVHASVAIWQNARGTLDVIGNWRRRFRESSDLIVQASSVADIAEAKRSGRTAVMLGFQNTDPYENDVELVGTFRQLGVCIAQLNYNVQNAIAGGAWDQPDNGLSNHVGRSMVREMNDVGVLIDLSHCGDRTTLDTIEYSDSPVSCTHANPVEFVGTDDWGSYRNTRNKSTDIIKAMADAGGVLGLVTYTRILPEKDQTTLARFCEMAEWTAETIGIDHVGIGTDRAPEYNEIERGWCRMGRWGREPAIQYETLTVDQPVWAAPAAFKGIADELLGRGWSSHDVAAFMGGNWTRLLEQVVG